MSYLDSPTLRARWLVIFSWGRPLQELKITDSDQIETSRQLGTFTPTPSLQLNLPENSASLDDIPLEIVVDSGVSSLFSDLAAGVHAPVEVQVWEEILSATSDVDPERFLHFRGQVSRATRNPGGQRGTVRLEVLGIKTMLEGTLGIPCNNQCVWQLGDQNCQTDVLADSTEILTVGFPRLITIFNAFTFVDSTYWERGWIEVEGLRIGIRKWISSDDRTFHLTEQPPASWAGKTATFYPGCDKTIETCRSRWDNEEFFGGFGYSIPSYDPLYESPTL